MKTKLLFFSFTILVTLVISCDRKDDEQNDFRDNYIGQYSCMETYFYFCPVGDTMNWCTDTIAFDRVISIEKSGDSAILISQVTKSISFDPFEAVYEGDDRFSSQDGSGNYAWLNPSDSIYVHIESGTTNAYEYRGKKY